MSGSSGDLVSTVWLAEHLDDPDIVVLDGSYFLPALQRDAFAEYNSKRIPGAIWFGIDDIKATDTDLPHMLPTAEDFATAVGSMGISNNSTVVAYDALGMMSAPRVWWTFKAFGHDRVKVLDGGLPKWVDEGRPLESGHPHRRPRASFSAALRRDLVTSKAEVLAASIAARSSAGVPRIVDARSAARWQGKEAEPRPGLASGRIPGSVNLPFGTLLRSDWTFLPPNEIRAKFAAAGVKLDEPFVASCGSGITACVVAFAASLVDGRASVYDGSWAEWGGDPALPVSTGTE